MINKLILLLFGLLIIVTDIEAQKLEVKEFSVAANDPAATQYAVKDYYGDNCALIIVGLAVNDVQFEGNILKQERKPNGEYWVYLTKGSKNFQINSNDYLPEVVNFYSFGITAVESGRTYRMFVEHPNLAKSFDELLEIANDYYRDYPLHVDYNYYEAAQLAIKSVFEHNDCPYDVRETVRIKRDSILSIRNNIYLIEAAEAKAKELETQKGFESKDVYRYLGSELNYINRLIKRHPEITGAITLRNDLTQKIQSHPEGKKQDGVQTIVHYRQQLHGTVSFKSKYIDIPFERMRIYATSTPDINESKNRIVGKVNSDGTYSIVKPDDIKPLYIYVTGEKDEAHFISEGTDTYNIVIKTNK